ncbi:MAG: DUF2267 domain-containing protein [Algibacter sp.]|uniref:DUF2267 domain-containing protein n=1 Tax=Algibacter sp. TaxID=1872428 RepID=UPI002604C25B|nr:DUF2267 domain-containing protein [Algibacter sp.]MDG1729457.1 DUF2267 domain-containing protein [Algibacter sp.]MDG2178643.1 DUF2267 domain-containing protein [Algibacter sp.]
MALNFNQFAKEANKFINDYTKELNLNGDTEKAGRILSSILHGLRELISTEESIQLIAQFPMFLKAVYVNGWSPKQKKTKVKTMDDFIDLVKSFDSPSEISDFGYDNDLAENYIYTTFIKLRKYISLGEIEDIRSELPKDLKDMVYHSIMF